MMKALKKVNWKKLGIFAGGVLFGTAGIKVLSSKDAKNVYTHCTAGVLRAKDCVRTVVISTQEQRISTRQEHRRQQRLTLRILSAQRLRALMQQRL